MRLDGQQIGRYHFERYLGSGGMGDVYLATDPRIQQQVAVKVLQEEASAYPSNSNAAAEKFRHEASAIARLRHPHIVPLYDYNETSIEGKNIFYLVMPFYKEGALNNWLEQHGADLLPLVLVTDFIQQAADALNYAHDHAIIHGDVKPSNFLVDTAANAQRPDLLLTDFGISRFISTSPGGTQSFGTLTYMAPEQCENRPLSNACDQYSLAIMAYELLTGRPPFQGPPGDLIRQHLQELPVRPTTVNTHLPKPVDNVIMRALDKRPENRFPSIADFAGALQQSLQPGKEGRESAGDIGAGQVEAGSIGGYRRSSGIREALPGNDIREVVHINPAEAYNGTRRVITLPGGRQITVTIPPRTSNGRVMTFPGLGEPSPGRGPAGNLSLTVAITESQNLKPPPPIMAQPQSQQQQQQQRQSSKRGLWIALAIIGGVLLLCIITYIIVLVLSASTSI